MTKTSGIKVKSSVKAGGLNMNSRIGFGVGMYPDEAAEIMSFGFENI